MSVRLSRGAALAIALAALVPVAAGTTSRGAGPEARGPSLTIYTGDLGLVRESRTLDLGGERDTVRLTDIPFRLDFSSVRLVPDGNARVTRLAYRYDVENGDRMIESARGSRVRVQSRGDRVEEGTLLSADGSWLVLRGDDGGVSTLARAAVEAVRLARPPATLSLRPTLEAAVEGGRRGSVRAELSYLTGGLSWSAEHLLVRQGEGSAVWSAAVQIENQCGRDFVDADLTLVAGEPRRVVKAPPMPQYTMMEARGMAASAAPDLSEQSFSEYHLYSLGRPATLRDRETQSLTMIAPHTLKVTPRYLVRGGDPRGVAAVLEIVNSAAAGLGVPLPAGRVRIYEPDAGGELRFIGETHIGHTPLDEKATLEIGTAFDLAAERREVESRRVSERERQYSVEFKLRNRKPAAVTIRIEENLNGDFEILQKSQDFVRKDARTIQFDVPVPAGKEALLTYTARVRF